MFLARFFGVWRASRREMARRGAKWRVAARRGAKWFSLSLSTERERLSQLKERIPLFAEVVLSQLKERIPLFATILARLPRFDWPAPRVAARRGAKCRVAARNAASRRVAARPNRGATRGTRRAAILSREKSRHDFFPPPPVRRARAARRRRGRMDVYCT